MPSLQEILRDPNYINANEATKRAIFERHAPLDQNYTGANDATQAAIRQRFGIGQIGMPVAAPEEPAQGALVSGFKSYVPSLQETYGGLKTLLGVGAERVLGEGAISKGLIESGAASMAEAEKARAPLMTKERGSFSDALDKGVGSVLTEWLPFQAGAGAAQVLEALALVGAGGLAGTATAPGPGTLAGAGTGLVARELAKRGVKEAAEKVLKERGEDAAKAYFEKQARDVALEIGKRRGQTAALAGQAAFYGTGQTTSRAVEEAEKLGGTATDIELARVLPAAAVSTVAEFLGDKISLGALKGITPKGGMGDVITRYPSGVSTIATSTPYLLAKNILLNIGLTGTKQVPVEVIQSAAERFGAKLSLADAQALKEYIDSAAASYAMSVGPGGVGGVRQTMAEREVKPEIKKVSPTPPAPEAPVAPPVQPPVAEAPLDQLTPQQKQELERQRALSQRPKTTEELLAEAGIQAGKPTTAEDIARIRDEHETAVIEGLLAQDAEMARANQLARRQLELESEAEATAGGISDVDARVREGRIFARVQDLIDRNIPFASTAINEINQKFGVINEAPLTEEERARIENIMGMVNTFTNFVNLPMLAPKPVDRFAENQAMEALIKERTERGQAEPLRAAPPAPSPRIEKAPVSQGVGEGTTLRPTSGVEPSVAEDRERVAPTPPTKPTAFESKIVSRQPAPDGMEVHVFTTTDGYGTGLFDADAGQYVNGSVTRFTGTDTLPKAEARAAEMLRKATPAAPAEPSVEPLGTRKEAQAFGKAIGATQPYPGELRGRVNLPAQKAAKEGNFQGVLSALEKSKNVIVAEIAKRARALGTKIVIDDDAEETYTGPSTLMRQMSIDGAKMHLEALNKIRALAPQVDALPDKAELSYAIRGETINAIDGGESAGRMYLEDIAKMGHSMFAPLPIGESKFKTKEDFKRLQKAYEDLTSEYGENALQLTSTGSAQITGVAGVYDAATDTIRVPEYTAKREEVLSHEIVHAQTVQAIANPTLRQKPIVARLNKLYEHVKTELEGRPGRAPYGIQSVQEFVAEGMGNPAFQFLLKKIKYENTSAWDSFVQTIANLIGVKRDTAFTELLSIYSDLTTEQKAAPKAEAPAVEATAPKAAVTVEPAVETAPPKAEAPAAPAAPKQPAFVYRTVKGDQTQMRMFTEEETIEFNNISGQPQLVIRGKNIAGTEDDVVVVYHNNIDRRSNVYDAKDLQKLLDVDPQVVKAIQKWLASDASTITSNGQELAKTLSDFVEGSAAETPAAPKTEAPAAPPILDTTGIKEVKGRHPQVQAAAQLLQDKKMTREEFEKYVDYYKPIQEVEAEKLLPPTSEQRMNETVNADKRDKINVPVADGTKVGLRMDLPARERGGSVVSIHEGKPGKLTVGKLMGFRSTGWLKDVTFEVRSQEKGLAVATGAAKAPQQTVEGTWFNLGPEETYARVKELMKDPAWTQVGFDPSRHGYFYDRKTREPVVSASEMYQVGQFLLAKNVKYAPKTDFLYPLGKEQTKQLQDFQQTLRNLLNKFGLKDVGLNIVEGMDDAGSYSQQLIRIAADEANPIRTLRHEAIHALRELGFFTDAQWKSLSKMAKDKWIDQYLKQRNEQGRPLKAGEESRYDAYMREYNGDMEKITEEAVADAFADFDATKPPPGLIQALLKRMKDLFQSIKSALTKIESPEQIFGKVEKGELTPGEKRQAGERKSVRDRATANFLRWFGDSKVVDEKGEPLVVYHGTNADITEFDPSKQDPRDAGFWFANAPLYANQYAAGRNGGNVMPVYLSLQNPKIYYDRTTAITPDLVETLKDQGFDGIVRDFAGGPEAWRYAEGQREYAVFRPEQIKSAIGNNGDYSLTNADIRKSLGKATDPGQQALETIRSMGMDVKPPEPGTFKKIKKALTDAGENPAGTKESAKKALIKFGDWFETTVFSGDAAWSNTIHRNIIKDMKENEEVLGKLLEIRQSQTVNADNVVSRGLIEGTIEYDDETKKHQSVKKDENFAALAKKLDELATKYALTKEQMERIAHTYLVAKRLPGIIKRNEELDAEIKAEEATAKPDRKSIDKWKSLKVFVSPQQEAMVEPGLSLLKDIPELSQIPKMINEIRKNHITFMVDSGLWSAEYAQAMWDNIDWVPFYREEQLEADAGPQEVIRGLQVKSKEFQMKGSEAAVNDVFENMMLWSQYAMNRGIRADKARRMIDVAKDIDVGDRKMAVQVTEEKRGMNIVRVYRDGKQELWDVADPMFMDAFASIQNVSMPMFKWAAKMANILRNSVVLYPLFSVAQVPQDSFAAMYTSGLKPQYALRIPILAVKEFIKTLNKTSATHNELVKYGVVGARTFNAEVMRKDAEIFAGLKPPKGGWNKTKDFLEHIAMSADNAVRQAVYEAARQQGVSKAEALEKAFEIFNVRRRGTSKALNLAGQTIPFFYAYLAAQRVAYQTITGAGTSPTERKAALQTLAATSAAVFTLSMLYAMMVADDEDYAETPAPVRDRTLTIPGTGGVRIPLRPDFFLLPKIVAEHTYLMLTDQGYEDGAKFRRSMRDGLVNAIASPTPLPQIAKPALEVAINYSFFDGKPVVGTFEKQKDLERQFNDSTSEFSKLLGQTGLVSPIAVDHLIRGMLGSAGGLALYGTNMFLHSDPDVPRPERSWKEAAAALPGTAGFLKRPQESALKNDFYTLRDEVEKAVNTFNDIKTRSPQGMEDFLADEKKMARYMLGKPVDQISRQLSKISRQITIITNMPENQMSAEDKSDNIRQLREFEREYLKSVDVKALREMAKI